jgi:transcriptional regulator with XRE-family HTH domain
VCSVAPAPASPLRKVLAANVRRLRSGQGISQEELAHRAGVHRTYLGAVERAEVNVSIDNIARISTALGVKAADLLLEG